MSYVENQRCQLFPIMNSKVGESLKKNDYLPHKINYSRTLGQPYKHIIYVVFSHNTKENVALAVVM